MDDKNHQVENLGDPQTIYSEKSTNKLCLKKAFLSENDEQTPVDLNKQTLTFNLQLIKKYIFIQVQPIFGYLESLAKSLKLTHFVLSDVFFSSTVITVRYLIGTSRNLSSCKCDLENRDYSRTFNDKKMKG